VQRKEFTNISHLEQDLQLNLSKLADAVASYTSEEIITLGQKYNHHRTNSLASLLIETFKQPVTQRQKDRRHKNVRSKRMISLNTKEPLTKFGLDAKTATYLESFQIRSLADIVKYNLTPIKEDKFRLIVLSIKAVYQYLHAGNLTVVLEHPLLQPLLDTYWDKYINMSKAHMNRILGYRSNEATLREVCTALQDDEQIKALKLHSGTIGKIRIPIWKLYFHAILENISTVFEKIVNGSIELPEVTFSTAPLNLTFPDLGNLMVNNIKEETLEILNKHLSENGCGDTSSVEFRQLNIAKQKVGCRFDALCSIVVQKLCAALERSGGVIAGQELKELTSGASKETILLSLRLATTSGYNRFIGDCLTTIRSHPMRDAITYFSTSFRSTNEYSISLKEAAEILRNSPCKLKLSPEATGLFLGELFDPKLVDNDRLIVAPFQSIGKRLTSILKREQKPMTRQKIVQKNEEISTAYPSVFKYGEPGYFDIDHIFCVSQDVIQLKRDQWCHISALPLSSEELDRVVSFCIKKMDASKGSVSMEYLINELKSNGYCIPPSSNLLTKLFKADNRIHRTGPWKYSTYIKRKEKQEERFKKILEHSTRPQDRSWIARQLPIELGVKSKEDLREIFWRIRGDILCTYDDRYCLKSVAGDQSELKKLYALSFEALPKDGTPVHCKWLLTRLKKKSPALTLFTLQEPEVWLSALLNDNFPFYKRAVREGKFEAGRYGFVARNDKHRKGLLIDYFIADIAQKYTVIDRELVQSKIRKETGTLKPPMFSVIANSLSRCSDNGLLWRVPFGQGLYTRPDIEFSLLFVELQNREHSSKSLVLYCRKNGFTGYNKKDLTFLAEYFRSIECFVLAESAVETATTVS
jgi:hypothetical protein